MVFAIIVGLKMVPAKERLEIDRVAGQSVSTVSILESTMAQDASRLTIAW